MSTSKVIKIAILAGEASGDLLGAKLIHALREYYPNLQIEGIGGPAMISAGCHSLFDIDRLSVMGFIEPLARLPDLIKLRHQFYRHLIKNPPDLFIGIDAPDFNLGLEKKIRRAGIPVVHYVSPSVWAWRQYRIHKIAKAVDLMLTLFPFEASIYEKHGIPVRYVGHPLAEQIPLQPDKPVARRALGLDENATYIAILPGSRRQEIRYMSEVFLGAANMAWLQCPRLRFITTHVNQKRYQEFYAHYQQSTPQLPIKFFTQRSHEVMAAADVIVVTSGTATLEAMLYKKPMIIAYRMSPLIYKLIRPFIKAPFAGLPNLLANEKIVPELIQQAATPTAISRHILDYLNHPQKVASLQQKFSKLHQLLRMDSGNNIASAIFDVIKK